MPKGFRDDLYKQCVDRPGGGVFDDTERSAVGGVVGLGVVDAEGFAQGGVKVADADGVVGDGLAASRSPFSTVC